MAQRVRTDWTLFWTIVFLVCFGLVMVFSSSAVVADVKFKKTEQAFAGFHFVVRQLGWAALSFVLMMICKRLDYRRLNDPRVAFGSLGVVMCSLVAVYILGSKHRWFQLPLTGHIQPSEFAKPVLVIFLAYFLTRRQGESTAQLLNDKHSLRQAGLVLGALALAIGLADLGTALVLLATAGVVFFAAGLSPRYCAIAAAAVVLFALAGVAAKPYRRARVVTFLDNALRLETSIADYDPTGVLKKSMTETENKSDTYYQLHQSKIAVGSGGLAGLGIMQGRQKWLFLPEAHTDFIYAIVGEELGLAGCTLILAGFVIIMWRGFRLYWTAPDDFATTSPLASPPALSSKPCSTCRWSLASDPRKASRCP